MTKLKRYDRGTSFGLTLNKGSADISVVGTPCDYYIFNPNCSNDVQPWSNKIGDFNKYHELHKLLDNNIEAFVLECTTLFNNNPRSWSDS